MDYQAELKQWQLRPVRRNRRLVYNIMGDVYGAKYAADGTRHLLRDVTFVQYEGFLLVKSGTVTYFCHEDERLLIK